MPGRKVFIKSVKSDVSDHQLKQIRAEIDILQSISHRNVVPLRAYFENPLPTIVLDWVEGGDLAAHVAARGNSLSWNERLNWLQQIASGLIAIHKCSVAPHHTSACCFARVKS